MKTKIISKTYLRDIEKYELKVYLDLDDYYISVKKLIECREKYIIDDNVVVMDDGYYVFEVIPKDKDYAMRLFIDKDKQPLEYYFDICRNARLDSKYNIPMYDDLYLDVTSLFGKINVLDEDELLEAYNMGELTKKELDGIYATKDRLIEEIQNGTNPCMQIDYLRYLDNM